MLQHDTLRQPAVLIRIPTLVLSRRANSYPWEDHCNSWLPLTGNLLLLISQLCDMTDRSGAITYTEGIKSQYSCCVYPPVQTSVLWSNPWFYKEVLPSDKGIIYISPARFPHCNLGFILCKHVTHRHWSFSWNLEWEPTLSYLWYKCQRWLENWKSLVSPNFHFNQ